MSSQHIHIFGNLFLPDPRDHLSEVELEKVNQKLPLFEKFKSSLNEKLKSSGIEGKSFSQTTTYSSKVEV